MNKFEQKQYFMTQFCAMDINLNDYDAIYTLNGSEYNYLVNNYAAAPFCSNYESFGGIERTMHGMIECKNYEWAYGSHYVFEEKDYLHVVFQIDKTRMVLINARRDKDGNDFMSLYFMKALERTEKKKYLAEYK